jgi:hypothetical protein
MRPISGLPVASALAPHRTHGGPSRPNRPWRPHVPDGPRGGLGGPPMQDGPGVADPPYGPRTTRGALSPTAASFPAVPAERSHGPPYGDGTRWCLWDRTLLDKPRLAGARGVEALGPSCETTPPRIRPFHRPYEARQSVLSQGRLLAYTKSPTRRRPLRQSPLTLPWNRDGRCLADTGGVENVVSLKASVLSGATSPLERTL